MWPDMVLMAMAMAMAAMNFIGLRWNLSCSWARPVVVEMAVQEIDHHSPLSGGDHLAKGPQRMTAIAAGARVRPRTAPTSTVLREMSGNTSMMDPLT